MFALSIDKREVLVLQNRATLIRSLLQDVPQLVVSIVYALHTRKFVSDIVLFTTVFGVGSIVVSALSWRTRSRILATNYGLAPTAYALMQANDDAF